MSNPFDEVGAIEIDYDEPPDPPYEPPEWLKLKAALAPYWSEENPGPGPGWITHDDDLGYWLVCQYMAIRADVPIAVDRELSLDGR